jgi:hypothetical protein
MEEQKLLWVVFFFHGSLWIFVHGTIDFHCVLVEPVDKELLETGKFGFMRSYISKCGTRVWRKTMGTKG